MATQTTWAVQGPEIELLFDFQPAELLCLGIGDFLRFAKQVFLLRGIETLHRQSRGFYVKYEGGHSCAITATVTSGLFWRVFSWRQGGK